MAPFLALLLTLMPAPTRTEWMRPESFHLAVGMSRAEALSALRAWNPKPGKDANELVVDYTGERAMTLGFKQDRLRSIRFELFVFLPDVRNVFEEQRKYLRGTFGEPHRASRSILVYDNTLPNVMVVATDDPKSEHGRKGLGVLAVRYYDPR